MPVIADTTLVETCKIPDTVNEEAGTSKPVECDKVELRTPVQGFSTKLLTYLHKKNAKQRPKRELKQGEPISTQIEDGEMIEMLMDPNITTGELHHLYEACLRHKLYSTKLAELLSPAISAQNFGKQVMYT